METKNIKFISAAFMMLFSIVVNAQEFFELKSDAKCNPAAALLLYKIKSLAPSEDFEALYKKLDNDRNLLKSFSLLYRNDIVYARGFIQPAPDFDWGTCSNLGIVVRRNYGKFFTADIPLKSLEQLIRIPTIRSLNIDQDGRKLMDTARQQCGVDQAHAGENLPFPVKGEGVLLGLVDTGLDFTSPAFRDSLGNMRIKKAWIMEADQGPHPEDFEYGLELSDSTSLINTQHDYPGMHHGTGVAAVAASSGLGTADYRYKGMAPLSDLVFVSLDFGNFGESMAIDGCAYIHDYAIEHNMPCVVNGSLAFDNSALDGTAYLDQYIDSMAYNYGFAMVAAAGNEGEYLQHISHSFLSDTIRSIIFSAEDFDASMDLWGQVNSEYSVSFGLVDGNGNSIASETHVQSTIDGAQTLTITNGNTSLNVEVAVASEYPTNNRPNMYVNLSFNNAGEGLLPYISITAIEGTVYVKSLFTDFLNYHPSTNLALEGFVLGDNEKCIAGTPGTGITAITTGAYNNRDSYESPDFGTITSPEHTPAGDHTIYSVKGYSEDGRIKPEITAPTCISQITSFSSLDAGLPEETWTDYITFEGRTYPIEGCQGGTSTAAPVVTGIVALVLSAHPEISIQELRDVITSSARTDEWTGNDLPNSTWGYGKIDAFSAIQQALLLLNIRNSSVDEPTWRVYPNPTKEKISLLRNGRDAFPTFVSIVDLTGKIVLKKQLEHINELSIDVSALQSGVYLIHLTSDTEKSSIRFMKL